MFCSQAGSDSAVPRRGVEALSSQRPDAPAGGSKVLPVPEGYWPLVARLAKSMISAKAVADLTAPLCAAPDFLT